MPTKEEIANIIAQTQEDIENRIVQAQIGFEAMTRKCFEAARDYWKTKEKPYEDLYKDIRNIIAKNISRILKKYSIGDEKTEQSWRVFLAPNPRGLKGSLLKKVPDVDVFYEYAERYGSLAENEESVDLCEKRFFMPVAFWAYKLYEKKLKFKDNGEDRAITMQGFSGWAARHGLLMRRVSDDFIPIYGFHFTCSARPGSSYQEGAHPGQDDFFKYGMLRFRFSKDPDGQIPLPLDITNQFIQKLSYKDNMIGWPGKENPRSLIDFSGCDNNELPRDLGVPIIIGTSSENEKKEKEERLSKAIFSIFFYSNFPNIAVQDDEDWNRAMDSILEADTSLPFSSLVSSYLTKYKDMYSYAKDAGGEFLTFKHYYAFLLNPDIDFKSKETGNGYSSLGTVNLYVDEELPGPLIGMIKHNLELVYHFLRGIEEWEEGIKKGSDTAFEQISKVLGHEVSKVYQASYEMIEKHNPENKANGNMCQFIHNIQKMTLRYGLLWGASSYAKIPADAEPWDEQGHFKEMKNYLRCIFSNAWQLYLIAEVIKGVSLDLESVNQNRDQEGQSDVEKIFELYSIDIMPFIKFDRNIEIFVDISRFGKENRSLVSKALYRWMMATIANAFKHIVLQKMKQCDPDRSNSASRRIGFVYNLAKQWERDDSKIISVRFEKENFNHENTMEFCKGNGLKISIENDYSGPEMKPFKLEKTKLVMALSAQEIIDKLVNHSKENREDAPTVSLDVAIENLQFQSSNNVWVSSVCLPCMAKEEVE